MNNLPAAWRHLEEREIEVPPNRLHPNPDNPRLEAGDVSELMKSIKEQGQVQALFVRPAPEHGPDHYVIEAGYRRWVAMRTWAESIRCHVEPLREGQSPAVRNLLIGLIENVHRADLHPIEKARAFGRLRDQFSMSQAEIAKATGISPSTVGNSLALLELTPGTQDKVLAGKLTTGDALSIVRRTRRQRRKMKKTGSSGLTGARWDPDWFTRNHMQARKAGTMCDHVGHSTRRRIGGIACGQCWETVIRQHEALVQQVAFQEQMDETLKKLAAGLGRTAEDLNAILGAGREVPFRPPWPVDHPAQS